MQRRHHRDVESAAFEAGDRPGRPVPGADHMPAHLVTGQRVVLPQDRIGAGLAIDRNGLDEMALPDVVPNPYRILTSRQGLPGQLWSAAMCRNSAPIG
jgi:hypothetical protein